MTNMIQVGTRAPDFTLETQFGTKFHLGDYAGQRNVLLLFYPLDWTPT
jgi:peroxiredoxin